jgi:hypothetical protein
VSDVTDGYDDEPAEAALLERLRALLGSDPPPDGMVARAEGLLAFRDVDRELVELLQDAAAEPAGLRGGVDTPERLLFELDGGPEGSAVSVEVSLDRDALRGQVLAGVVTEVELERLGMPLRTSSVDALGQFAFADPLPGPTRLRLSGSAARPRTTDWFLL